MFQDWVNALTIMFLFSIFLMVDTYNGSVQSVQDNWNLHRCNPIVMPFAGYLAPNGSTVSTEENFSYCIQSMMTNFSPSITLPFSYLQSMTADMMGSLNENVSNTNTQSSMFTMNVSSIFASIYGVFFNVIVEFNVMILKMLDMQGKLSGIMTTMMYIMTVVQYTFVSMWAGVPGKMIQTMGKL